MMINPILFKVYDIRGTVPQQLNSEVARMLGLACGQAALTAGEPRVAVGRDGRLSGPMLAEALIRGLLQSGVDVLDIGRVTTPMLYFGASTLCRSGIQITGSHNPKDDNGFKMMLQGQTLHGEAIQALHRTITTGVQPAQTPGQQHT
ncbi:MAG: phosphomannomutase/phosphoglucomutase, partial [Pseudomonadota bacterium]